MVKHGKAIVIVIVEFRPPQKSRWATGAGAKTGMKLLNALQADRDDVIVTREALEAWWAGTANTPHFLKLIEARICV